MAVQARSFRARLQSSSLGVQISNGEAPNSSALVRNCNARAQNPSVRVPSWIGEEIPVPYEIAAEVGEVRRVTEEEYRKRKSLGEISRMLAEKYSADETTIRRALTETYDQCEEGLPVPSDRLLTIEEWDDFIIINSHLGTLVNRTLARLVGHVLSDEAGVSIGIQQDPYRVVLQTMGTVDADDVQKVLQRLADTDVKELAVACVRCGSEVTRRDGRTARAGLVAGGLTATPIES